jgi:hypothetical protein
VLFNYTAPAGMDADDAPAPQKVNLFGTGSGGTAPIASLSQVSLNFANQKQGTTSSPQTVALVNAGGATLNITGIVPSGDFHISSNSCSSTLDAGTYCLITVNFQPSTTGQRNGMLTFTFGSGNLSGLLQTVSLTGKGTP